MVHDEAFQISATRKVRGDKLVAVWPLGFVRFLVLKFKIWNSGFISARFWILLELFHWNCLTPRERGVRTFFIFLFFVFYFVFVCVGSGKWKWEAADLRSRTEKKIEERLPKTKTGEHPRFKIVLWAAVPPASSHSELNPISTRIISAVLLVWVCGMGLVHPSIRPIDRYTEIASTTTTYSHFVNWCYPGVLGFCHVEVKNTLPFSSPYIRNQHNAASCVPICSTIHFVNWFEQFVHPPAPS